MQVKGRTLSLNEGKLQTTDDIFKTQLNLENGVPEDNIISSENTKVEITNVEVAKEAEK